MVRKEKGKLVERSVSEKLEIIQARQKGLKIEDLKQLYRVGYVTLRKWEEAYERGGLAALEQTGIRRGPKEISEQVKAAEGILEEMKPQEPNAGIGKFQGALYRRGFLKLARETVRKLLRRTGHDAIFKVRPIRNKPKKVRQFERATPNELWQTDIMTFMIKGQYRVYMIGFMDDHSRFMVSWGLYRFQTAANVMEVFRAGIEKHGMPKEVLSDNGRQYYTWRGKSKFTELLTKLGIRHIRSRPYHPQTLGKVESFWRNLYQECLTQLPLSSFEEAQEKISTYIEYYNFKRPHQGIGNLTPSDRFYKVAGQIQQIIEKNTAQVQENSFPTGEYRAPAYLVGNLGGKELRVIARDAEVSLEEKKPEIVESNSDGERESVGGSPDSPLSQTVQQNANASLFIKEVNYGNGKSEGIEPICCRESQMSQPAGKIGIDSVGACPSAIDREFVQGSGDIPGTVLPVDGESADSGSLSVGGETPRPQTVREEKSADGASSAQRENGTVAQGEPQTQEGEPSLILGSEGGTENHPTSSVGTDPQSGL